MNKCDARIVELETELKALDKKAEKLKGQVDKFKADRKKAFNRVAELEGFMVVESEATESKKVATEQKQTEVAVKNKKAVTEQKQVIGQTQANKREILFGEEGWVSPEDNTHALDDE
ncbi:hypothetical protein [Helicobacter felistomachi]|uniref:hypothetical protein n=1 Tax=Helicobacter felistomachi TaxID=3040201 RepID=UPI002572AF1C|nr:hypothetical protein [Helicobacter sp. NHP21005]